VIRIKETTDKSDFNIANAGALGEHGHQTRLILLSIFTTALFKQHGGPQEGG